MNDDILTAKINSHLDRFTIKTITPLEKKLDELVITLKVFRWFVGFQTALAIPIAIAIFNKYI